jgi:L-asparaginase II
MPALATPRHTPLIATTRGGQVECVYYGSIAVVDRSGILVAGAGDPHALNFSRSALKPLQALPFVEAGGMSRFSFTSQELALMCASHSGEPVHVGIVGRMLERIGASEADLQCGNHVPMYYAATGTAVPAGGHFGPLHHNCSGKHCGFLAYCRMFGHRSANYLDIDGPLQTRIRNVVQAFAGGDPIAPGIDGCSAPNYALPLARLAQAYCRLALGDTPELAALRFAMTRHPDLVSGTRRVDLALTQTGQGDWVSKIGAEGVQAIGIRSQGIGIAIRIADGNAQALAAATIATLQQLGLLDDPKQTPLAPFFRRAIRNYRGVEVGRIVPQFELPRVA